MAIERCRQVLIPTVIEARRGSVLVMTPGPFRMVRRFYDQPRIVIEAPSIGLGLSLQPLGQLKIVDSRRPPLHLLRGKPLVALQAIAAELRAVVGAEATAPAGEENAEPSW